jgi:protein SCO1/2
VGPAELGILALVRDERRHAAQDRLNSEIRPLIACINDISMTNAGRIAVGMLLLAAGLSCRRAEAPAAADSSAPRRYAISGTIREVGSGRPEITLAHDPIEGFMESMTMPFPVRGDAGVLSGLSVGDRISATLVVDGGKFWLEGIRKSERPVDANAAPGIATTPRPNRGTPVGEVVQDFALLEQTGREVRLRQFRGEPVAVTFLYTRCPIATACPMTVAKFSKLDAMLARAGFGVLLTVTVDPEHDTPKVLADYASRAGADPKRWKFLTGAPKDVAEVAERFGVLYYPDKGQVVHQQAVAVLDSRGRLSTIYYGETWEPEHIFRDMEKARNG